MTESNRDFIRETQLKALQAYVPKSKFVKESWKTLRQKPRFGI